MMPSSGLAFRVMQNGMVSGASFLVPSDQRAEWRREWQSELWHVRHSLCEGGALSPDAQREITAFCIGSVQDALCLRREFRHAEQAGPHPSASRLDGAAGQCILRLFTVLAVCVVIARLLPGVQVVRDPARFQVSPGVVLIQTWSQSDQSVPDITAEQYRDWTGTRQRYFDDFAFYQTIREMATLPSRPFAGWLVTHASPNLFSLLGLQLPFDPSADGSLPIVILSHQSWRHDFASDPDVAGRLIRIGNRTARIAGVMPFGMWRLPGQPDAWLLDPGFPSAEATSAGAKGYLLGHLNRLGQDAMQGWSIPITVRASEDDPLYAVSFANRLRGPFGMYEFALILALLAVPAVTSVTLGESNYSSHRPSRKRTLYRWAFLAAKFLLVASISYFASLDLAYGNVSNYSPLAELVQLFAAFGINLLGFGWALADQRQRCPVCLRRVTHPARVGVASRTFLGWNGTEMMCMGGHTLLHVPSLPTSWFGGQRWLYLDTSWEVLFADSGAW